MITNASLNGNNKTRNSAGFVKFRFTLNVNGTTVKCTQVAKSMEGATDRVIKHFGIDSFIEVTSQMYITEEEVAYTFEQVSEVEKVEGASKRVDITENESLVITELEFIKDSDEWYMHFSDLSSATGLEIKSLRGVLSSLVKKGIIEIDDFFSTGIKVVCLMGAGNDK